MNAKRHNVVVMGVHAFSEDQKDEIKLKFDDYFTNLVGNFGIRNGVNLLGDFSARTGKNLNSKEVCPFGEEKINQNGERIINLCHYLN